MGPTEKETLSKIAKGNAIQRKGPDGGIELLAFQVKREEEKRLRRRDGVPLSSHLKHHLSVLLSVCDTCAGPAGADGDSHGLERRRDQRAFVPLRAPFDRLELGRHDPPLGTGKRLRNKEQNNRSATSTPFESLHIKRNCETR